MGPSVSSKVRPLARTEQPPTGLPHFHHPLPDLLDMSAAEILAAYRGSQRSDFLATLGKVREGAGNIATRIGILRRYLDAYPSGDFQERLHVDTVELLFRQMHEHVMAHPVWLHPFFVRMTAGEATSNQLRRFAQHYFNQVKNTRQCVALALGRFHSVMDRADGELNNVLSELTQVVLAGLLSDEYGMTAAHGPGKPETDGGQDTAALDIDGLFASITHPELFRRFLDALGGSASDYDVPMLHAVADNVLVQRILAAHPAYSELEALASVGLGMEWGVPAFFSMIIAGITKVARREGLALEPGSMEIWTSHVKQDVEHAIAVMVATSFYVGQAADARRVEGATNVLMAFRYNMMSDIYAEVFGTPCASITDIDLDPRYRLHDRRIVPLLAAERSRLRPAAVRDYDAYMRKGIDICVLSGV